ncbi:MAG: DUF2780 domain-containing protein [Methylobacter sp.]
MSDPTGAIKTLEARQAVTAAVPATTGNGLTTLLIQQLGVTQSQAEGGTGAIFQLAKSKMEGAAFAELSNSVPGMQDFLAAAPVAKSIDGGGLGGMAGDYLESRVGNSGEAAGNLNALASSFKQLGLPPYMVEKFVPIIQYVKGNGGGVVEGALHSVLMGGGS